MSVAGAALALALAAPGVPAECVDSLWDIQVDARPGQVQPATWCAAAGEVRLPHARWRQMLGDALPGLQIPDDARLACAPAGVLQCRADAAARVLQVRVPAAWIPAPALTAPSDLLPARPGTLVALDYRGGIVDAGRGAPSQAWAELAPRVLRGPWEAGLRARLGAGDDAALDWHVGVSPARWPVDVAVGRWSWAVPGDATALTGVRVRRASERARRDALEAGALRLRGVAESDGDAELLRDGRVLSSLALMRGRYDIPVPLDGGGVQDVELRQGGQVLAALHMVRLAGHLLPGEWTLDARAGRAEGRPGWAVDGALGLPRGVSVGVSSFDVGRQRQATLQLAAAPWRHLAVDLQAGTARAGGRSMQWHAERLSWWGRGPVRAEVAHWARSGGTLGPGADRRWDVAALADWDRWGIEARGWRAANGTGPARGGELGVVRHHGRWRTDLRWQCHVGDMRDCGAVLRLQAQGARWYAGASVRSPGPAPEAYAHLRMQRGPQRFGVGVSAGQGRAAAASVDAVGPHGEGFLRVDGDGTAFGWASGTLATSGGTWTALPWSGGLPLTLLEAPGLPGVTLRVDGGTPQRTDRHGRVIATGLPRYADAQIDVDPDSLPPDVRIAQRGWRTHLSGQMGTRLRLPVTRAGPPLRLSAAARARIPVGTPVRGPDGRTGLVGHDGYVWYPGDAPAGPVRVGDRECTVVDADIQCAP